MFALFGVLAWTTANGQPPSAVSIDPSYGTGLSRSFTATFSNPSGANQTSIAAVAFVPALGGSPACYFSLQFGALWLMNDADRQSRSVAARRRGNALEQVNVLCRERGAAVSAVGITLTMTVPVTFTPSFAGVKQTYLYVADAITGLGSGWQQLGSWTVGSPQPPSSVSIYPSSGAGLSASFTATYSNPSGANQTSIAAVAFVPSLGGSPACYFSLQFGALWLMNDAGTASLGPLTPGAAGTLSNSQCTVWGTGSAVSAVGTMLTMTVPVTFTPSFAGLKQAYLYVSDAVTGLGSGWQALGSWTVASVPITITASPIGRTLTVDGATCSAPCTYYWAPGSSHSIAALSPQSGEGTQYVYQGWSDGGAQAHTISTPESAAIFTATFNAASGNCYICKWRSQRKSKRYWSRHHGARRHCHAAEWERSNYLLGNSCERT